MTIQEKHVTCGFCQGGCAVIAEVDGGKLVGVKPDRESPKGRLCVRGALAPKLIYSEERLRSPLIRTGERGEGKFREATWEEAYEHAAKLLLDVREKWGARALASYFGRGVLFNPVFGMSLGPKAFLRNLGSPNDSNCSAICNTATSTVAPVLSLGVKTMQQVQDVPNSDLVISWGKNSATDDGPQVALAQIKEAQERGAKLVVIDPREGGLGEIADWWIPIVPGTDGALANAICKIIIEEDLYDHDFVEKWTVGFDEYAKYLAGQSLDDIAKITGVPVDAMHKLTEMFCATEKVSLISYTGLEYAISAIQTIRAQYVMWAITGKLDVEGSIYLNAWGVPTQEMLPFPKENPPLGEKTPIYYGCLGSSAFSRVPDAVLKDEPYPVRGVICAGGSPAVMFPATNVWREAYKKLEALIVVDRYPTEEMRYADVVFPARTLYEMWRYRPTPEGPVLLEPVIDPVEGTEEECIIFGRLAKALGVDAGFPTTIDELKTWLVAEQRPYVAPLRVPPQRPRKYKKYETGDLRADGQPGFPTASGKFEICSGILRDYGYTPYPEYTDMRSLPEFSDTEAWPFIMTTGARDNKRMGALGSNLAEIGEGIDKKPMVTINEEDAAALGIEQGDRVKIETPFGEAFQFASVGGMTKGCIHVPHGGGSTYSPEVWEEGGVNLLTSLDYYDPISGFVMLKSIPCRISKA